MDGLTSSASCPGLEAMTGRFAESKPDQRRIAIHERLGQSFSSGDCENFRGEIELLAEDLVAAEHAFRSLLAPSS